MIRSRTDGTSRGIDAAYEANCDRAVGVSGVTLDPYGYTETKTRIPASEAAWAALARPSRSLPTSSVWPGAQSAVSRMASNPARLASRIFASDARRSPCLPASSAAPTMIGCRPATAEPAVAASTARRQAIDAHTVRIETPGDPGRKPSQTCRFLRPEP